MNRKGIPLVPQNEKEEKRGGMLCLCILAVFYLPGLSVNNVDDDVLLGYQRVWEYRYCTATVLHA